MGIMSNTLMVFLVVCLCSWIDWLFVVVWVCLWIGLAVVCWLFVRHVFALVYWLLKRRDPRQSRGHAQPNSGDSSNRGKPIG